jgi:NAD-dependent DNA ligase
MLFCKGEIMASEKPTMILLSKSDLSKEEISVLSDSDAWQLIYSIRVIKAKDTRLQVCFTGFSASKKQELIHLANLKNFKVVSSVTKKLVFLCGGENAGPMKIEKAEQQGVQYLNAYQFIQLVETGEIP